MSFNLGRKINALFLRGRWHLGGNPVKFPWRKVFSLLGGWAAKLVGRGLPAISGPCFSRGPRERNGEMMPIQLEKKHCSCCIEASCKIQKKMGGNKCVDLIPQKKNQCTSILGIEKKKGKSSTWKMPTGREICFSSLKATRKKKNCSGKSESSSKTWKQSFRKSSNLEMIEGYLVIFHFLPGRKKFPRLPCSSVLKAPRRNPPPIGC